MRIAVVLILSMSLCFACKKDNDDKATIVGNVEEEFQIDLIEKLDGEQRELVLSLKSVRLQGCANSTIDYQFDRSDIHLRVVLNDIVPPQNCIPQASPARSSVPLGILEAELYNLQLNLKSAVVNRGRLITNKEEYRILMDQMEGIHLPNTTLKRIPEQAIWGYIGLQADGNEHLINDFLSKLEVYHTNTNFDNGYYGHYTIKDQKITVEQMPTTYRTSEAFLFNYEVSKDVIFDFVSQYRDQNPNNLVIKLFTSEGEEF